MLNVYEIKITVFNIIAENRKEALNNAISDIDWYGRQSAGRNISMEDFKIKTVRKIRKVT